MSLLLVRLGGSGVHNVFLTGSVSFQGGLSKTTTKVLIGDVNFQGLMSKSTLKTLLGSVNFQGGLIKTITKLLTGSVSFSGSAIKTMTRVVAGVLWGAGNAGDLTAEKESSGGSSDVGGIITHPSNAGEPGNIT